MDTSESLQDAMVTAAVSAQKALFELENVVAAARLARNEAVELAYVHGGVSGYHLAKAMRVSQSTITRILGSDPEGV